MPSLNDSLKIAFEISKQLEEIKAKIEKPMCKGYNQYLFCPHYHYKNLKVTGFIASEMAKKDGKEAAAFILKENGWELENIGGYGDQSGEIESAFRSWLAKDGSGSECLS